MALGCTLASGTKMKIDHKIAADERQGRWRLVDREARHVMITVISEFRHTESHDGSLERRNVA